jgi:23S rRNA pseudouridine955/2504/2580 synthase
MAAASKFPIACRAETCCVFRRCALPVVEQEVVAGAELKVQLPVVYEDDGLLVVDKPAGIAVHGGSGESFGVIEALRRQRPQARFLELAHRLDRETSGILLLGKKRSALLALHEMFREGGAAGGAGADKRYLVLVCGRWMDPLRHVRLPLLKYLQASGERRVRVSEEGKAAHTVFRLLARWERFSLLEAELRTGRTHQIRVHLAHLGYPIAGDEKYGDFALNKALAREGLKRMFLHASRMRLPHPLDGSELVVEAALPPALHGFVQGISAKRKAGLWRKDLSCWSSTGMVRCSTRRGHRRCHQWPPVVTLACPLRRTTRRGTSSDSACAKPCSTPCRFA